MSKYKIGDKIVMVIADEIDAMLVNKGYIDKTAKPLYTYTEPLEAKIRRQETEITRLLAENKELKETKTEDIEHWCDVCTKQSVIEQARAEGQNEAWELARKIVLYGEDVYSGKELKEIFDCTHTQEIIRNHTYPEAATKVAEWEKTKEEIKVGDVLEGIYDNTLKCMVTNLCPDNIAYLVFDDGTTGICALDNFKKTGRHIDLDSFLKQKGGAE